MHSFVSAQIPFRSAFQMLTRRISLVICLLTVGALHTAVAQSTYGNFVGTITDASGAVVPNATVTVTKTDTGEARTATTDARGDFSVVNLDAGVYAATVQAPGFALRELKDLHLLSRETVRLDTALQVGGGSQAVVVTATNEDIEEDLTKGDTKSGRQINELALNFRASNATSPLVVAPLTPQVQTDQSGNYSLPADYRPRLHSRLTVSRPRAFATGARMRICFPRSSLLANLR